MINLSCTCHPDDSPPFPCPRKYALSECRAAAPPTVQAEPAQQKQPRIPTSCGYCTYEEADGELIEQCPRCKAKDAATQQQADEFIAKQRPLPPEMAKVLADNIESLYEGEPQQQAEPVACSYCGMRSGHLAACQRPPADDEAVRLLREARDDLEQWNTCQWNDSETEALIEAIDTYLEKVGK